MTDQTALELFRSAYENRYTWDQNFPGFSADVQFTLGDQVHTGKVTVTPDFKVEVTDLADETAREVLYNQIRDVVTHRKRNAFEQAHGKNSFSLGNTLANGAVEILVQGDAMGSNYQVRDREICQVSRVMGRMAFTIDHKASFNTGEGYLSTRYDAIFRNAASQDLMQEAQYEDTYEQVGDYYLMTHQVIRRQSPNEAPVTEEFSFSNVRLLEPAAV